MATSVDYKNFILENLDAYDVSARAMMGEYVVYCKGKVVGGLYDNRLLVKPTEAAKRLMPNADYVIPYEGSKALLMVDNVDDKEFLGQLLSAIADELPLPKKKNKK